MMHAPETAAGGGAIATSAYLLVDSITENTAIPLGVLATLLFLTARLVAKSSRRDERNAARLEALERLAEEARKGREDARNEQVRLTSAIDRLTSDFQHHAAGESGQYERLLAKIEEVRRAAGQGE